MNSTYLSKDVTLLLKDVSGLVIPKSNIERETLIQRGVHYSEMLPIEYEPSKEYMEIFYDALNDYSQLTANAVATVSNRIIKKRGDNIVLVSFARAGTSIGVLIKRYIEWKFNINVPHYSISIIRDKGIDENAINFIINKHGTNAIQFVDGWTGKGTINNELIKSLKNYKDIFGEIAVLSDPAYITSLCGTHRDFLIASSCLNSTVSGLISRTIYRDDLIKDNDFHGSVFYKNLINVDETYNFINSIVSKFSSSVQLEVRENDDNIMVLNELKTIMSKFAIEDFNLIKPGIGETTRVLLRRIPWKILVNSIDDNDLSLIYKLSKEKYVEMELYPMKYYKAIGLIKNLKDI